MKNNNLTPEELNQISEHKQKNDEVWTKIVLVLQGRATVTDAGEFVYLPKEQWGVNYFEQASAQSRKEN